LLRSQSLTADLAGVASGLLFVLALPPFHFSPLAWGLALPLLLVCVHRSPTEALVAAYAFGVVASSQAVYGVFAYDPLVALFVQLVCPLWIVLPVALWLWCRRSPLSKGSLLLVPFFWVTSDLLFIEVFSLPMDTSTTLARDLGAVQFASILGAAGLTFMMVLTGVLATFGITAFHNNKPKPGWGWLVIALAVPVSLHLLGHAVWLHESDDPCSVEAQLAQPVIPISQSGNSWRDPAQKIKIRNTVWRYLDEAAKTPAQVFIWPEGSSGLTNFRVQQEANPFVDYARNTHKHLFITATDIDHQGQRFNALFGIRPTGLISRYDKTKLVPLAEKGTVAGSSPAVAPTDFGTVGLGICFEVCFPDHMRQAAEYGVTFLLVSTSDMGFGISSMPELHLAESIIRAVENRRSVLHAANGGPSAIIDPYGRLLIKTRFLEPALLQGCVPGPADASVFSAGGYLFRYLCVLVSVIGFILASLRRFKQRPEKTSVESVALGSLALGLVSGVLVSMVMVAISAWLTSQQAAKTLTVKDIVASLQPTLPTTVPGRNRYASPNHMSVTTLVHIASYYGVEVTADELLKDEERFSSFLTLQDMAQAARDVGLEAELLELHLDQLAQEVMPLIISIGSLNGRYAVLYSIDDDGTPLLFDPLLGLGPAAAEAFTKIFNGKALRVHPPVKAFVSAGGSVQTQPGPWPIYQFYAEQDRD